MKKCVFLDRDGVINVDPGDYTYRIEDFKIIDGVIESINKLKAAGYLIIVVTNQAGISKGLYTKAQMDDCHHAFQVATGYEIDQFYHCPYHPSVTQSLARKPDTLMLERAIAKYNIDQATSWLVGDSESDIECGRKIGLTTIRIMPSKHQQTAADHIADDLLTAVTNIILA